MNKQKPYHMKKILLALVMLVTTSLISKAENSFPTVTNDSPIVLNGVEQESPTGFSDNKVDAKQSKDSSVNSAMEMQKKKKKKKLKTWQYIVGGAVIVLIAVVSIIAPNGYNSRTGI
jgi:hypothetical protein